MYSTKKLMALSMQSGFIHFHWFPLLMWGRNNVEKWNFCGGIFHVIESDSSCWDFFYIRRKDNRESTGAESMILISNDESSIQAIYSKTGFFCTRIFNFFLLFAFAFLSSRFLSFGGSLMCFRSTTKKYLKKLHDSSLS